MNFPYQIPRLPPILLLVLLIWSLIWKGVALWRAAKYDQKNWFIAILVLDTIGIVEIIYLFGFAKEKLTLKKLRALLKLRSN